jgi:hypothetical protein
LAAPCRPAKLRRAIRFALAQNLSRDLETGEWERRYAELLALDEYDAGYRLVIAD